VINWSLPFIVLLLPYIPAPGAQNPAPQTQG
jgi:hypothetical protein